MQAIRLAVPTLAVVAGIGAILAGCDSKDRNRFVATPPNTGIVEVEVTDNPLPYADVSAVKVRFTRVELREVDDELEDVSGAGASRPLNATEEIDLLALRDGRTAEIVDGLAETDTYKGIRLTMDKITVFFKDGRIAEQRGSFIMDAPLLPNIRVEQNEEKKILVDVDLARSVTIGGTPEVPTVTFAPVGRAAVRNVGNGSLVGVVKDGQGNPVADAHVEASASGVPVASTKTAANGGWTILELAPGSYVVTASKGEVSASASSAVTVTASQPTTVEIILVPQEAQPPN